MAQSFDSLTAAQIAAGVAAGDFTATEVAQASLAAIEAREGGRARGCRPCRRQAAAPACGRAAGH